MRNNILKLDQLTSLRFFAAIMIVFHHSYGLFGLENSGNVNLGQGVSFFFVLSGFILTYVYSNLSGYSNIKHFYKARFARIWPVYIASFLFGYFLLDYSISANTIIPFIFMVQAWIPISTYYFSYNAVAWSISTEIFFYLVFPILIYSWNSTKLNKLFFSLLILFILMVITNWFELPSYTKPLDHTNFFGITTHGLIYISPLSRILEFIFGMFIAQAYKNNLNHKEGTSLKYTIYEILTVILVVVSMFYTKTIIQLTKDSFLNPALGLWIIHSGSMFAFGLLIYIMAYGKGKISKILSYPFFVILGEISFSIYLFHQILLSYYRQNINNFSYFSDNTMLIIYLIILICISYLAWVFIELPFRKFLMGNKKIHFSFTIKNVLKDNKMFQKSNLIMILLLLFLILLVFLPAKKNYIYSVYLSDIKVDLNKINLGIPFFDISKDNYFKNNSIEVVVENNNVKLNTIDSDPIIILNQTKTTSKNVILSYEIDSDIDTTFQIFYKKEPSSSYNEIDSYKVDIKKGNNKINLLLPSEYLNNELRLDLVSHIGNYKVKSLKIFINEKKDNGKK